MTTVTETVKLYSDDYYLTVIGSIRPLACTPEPVRRMKRHYYYDIEKVLSWDEETKEKLVDVLTDIVSTPSIYNLDVQEWLQEVEKKIQEFSEFDILQRLKGYLEHIDPVQRRMLVRMAVNRIISHIDTILRELVIQMSYENSPIKEIFVIGSLLRLIRNLLELYLRSENSQFLTISTALILRFASYIQGKIGLNDVQKDISYFSEYLKSEQIPEEAFRAVYAFSS